MRIELTDPRLTRSERCYLEALAEKLKPQPRQPLPEGYRQALQETFGDCGEGERDRWQSGKPASGPGARVGIQKSLESARLTKPRNPPEASLEGML
jgi:hypothetical protein